MNFQAQLASLHPSLYLAAHPSHHALTGFNPSELTSSMPQASELLQNSRKIQKKRSKYQRIDDTIRQKLVDAVTKEGQMLKAAAKKFKINYSSAKSIFHTYRKEGRINKKAVRERFGRKNSSLARLNRTKIDVKSTEESQASPESTDSPKQSTQSPLQKATTNSAFSCLSVQSSTVLPDIKVESSGSSQLTSKLTMDDKFLPNMTKMAFPNNACISVPPVYQNLNLMQNIINQANNIKLYEELAKLQRTTPPALPLMYGKPQLNEALAPFGTFPTGMPTMPTMGTMPMIAMQKQMQAFPFAGYQQLEGQMQLNGGIQMVNGFQYPLNAAMFPKFQ